MSAFRRNFRALLLLVLICLLFGIGQDFVRRQASGEQSLIPAPSQYLGVSLDPRVLRRLLGLRVVAADIIWVDTLIKADILTEPEQLTSIYRAFRASVTLDPDNLFAYYVAGMYLSVIKSDIKGATLILREGAKRLELHPYPFVDAWRLPFTLGYNLVFEEQETEEGSYWIRKAAEMKGAPQVVTALAKRVNTEAGRLEVAARVLNDMHKRTSRPEERKRVESKMLEIAVQQELLELNQRFKEFRLKTRAYAFAKNRQLMMFFRHINHSGRDLMGRRLTLMPDGKIAAEVAQSQ